MPSSTEAMMLAVAALVYMAKTVYELVRDAGGRKNGGGNPIRCSDEVIAILKRQTEILGELRDQECRILENTQRHTEDMRELLVLHRTDGRRLSAD